jgi:hypothetical protein
MSWSALPDQRLMRPRHHLDRLGLSAVPGQRTQLVRVGTDHIGEHVGIRGVAFGSRHAQPIPVAGRLQRINREHGVPGREQRLHPRAAVGLDPDYDLGIIGILTELIAD